MTSRLSGAELRRLLGAQIDGQPSYQWLVDRMSLLVADGRLVHGTRLPSERELSEAMALSRTTVTRAYSMLRDRGLAAARQGSGTVIRVSSARTPGGAEPLVDEPASTGPLLDLRSTSQAAPVGLHSAFVHALEQLPTMSAGMGYYPAGLEPLRERIAAQYTDRGVATTPDQIIVTSGALAGAAAAFAALMPRGGRVVVETPSYPNTTEQLRNSRARVVAVPFGARPGAVLDSADAMLVIPDFHNPTGALLTEDERAALAASWRAHGVVGVVDETMAFTWIDAQPAVRPMAAHAGDCVTLGSASKTFWGGLRIGWIRAPRALVPGILRARLRYDLGAAVLEQLAVCQLLDRQDEVLATARARWRRNRQVVLGLAEAIPGATTTVPAGGLSLWWQLPEPASGRLAIAAARHGVRIASGTAYAVDGRSFQGHLRTPFVLDEAELTDAVQRLGAAWAQVAAGPTRRIAPVGAVRSWGVPRIAVVGGGIAGLSAAWQLSHAARDYQIVVFESTDRVGGKLRTATVAGHRVDVGAESVLARRTEAVELINALDLPLVHPAPVGAQLWTRDALRPLPAGSFMGIPSDAATLAGVLTPAEVDRAAAERPVQVTQDVSVGDLVQDAFGSAVVDRLVEPLLGGVYAGQARLLSAAACMPALYDVARQGGSLHEAVARFVPPAPADQPRPPVFASVRGGIGLLPAAMAAHLSDRGVRVRTGTTVHGLRHEQGRWVVASGGMRDQVQDEFDAVVLAAPAHASAKLLRGIDDRAAHQLSQIEYASMVVITYAFPAAAMPYLDGSGFLVPSVDGHAIKASTFTSVKWPWTVQQAPEVVYVRVSLGRHGETATLQRPDAELARAGLQDLAQALQLPLPEPLDTHVQRWGGGLPQYAVGHVERVAAIEDSLAAAPTVQLAGAAYEGVGIPACIASGARAAHRIIDLFTPNDEE